MNSQHAPVTIVEAWPILAVWVLIFSLILFFGPRGEKAKREGKPLPRIGWVLFPLLGLFFWLIFQYGGLRENSAKVTAPPSTDSATTIKPPSSIWIAQDFRRNNEKESPHNYFRGAVRLYGRPCQDLSPLAAPMIPTLCRVFFSYLRWLLATKPSRQNPEMKAAWSSTPFAVVHSKTASAFERGGIEMHIHLTSEGSDLFA
jgi:hypothetical protein